MTAVRVSSSTARAFGVKGVKRAHKYGAVKVREGGFVFDSKAEHRHWCELRLLERAGQISELKVHPRFPLEVNAINVGVFTPDFTYREKGRLIAADVKGVRTTDYVLRSKLFQAIYPDAEFREVKL